MKKHTTKQYARALSEGTSGLKGAALESVVNEFARIVARERATHLLDSIIKDYVAYERKKNGTVSLNVTVRDSLSGAAKKSLTEIFGKETEIEETKDESILGGLAVRVGDTVYDGTVRTQLLRMKANLLA